MLKNEKLYLITYNPKYTRRSKPAHVIGIRKVTFSDGDVSFCYHIEYDDGVTNFVRFQDVNENDWHFVTLDDMLRYGSP